MKQRVEFSAVVLCGALALSGCADGPPSALLAADEVNGAPMAKSSPLNAELNTITPICLPNDASLIALGRSEITFAGATQVAGGLYLGDHAHVVLSGKIDVDGTVFQGQDVTIEQSGDAQLDHGIVSAKEDFDPRVARLSEELREMPATETIDLFALMIGPLKVRGNGGLNVLHFPSGMTIGEQSSLLLSGGTDDVYILNIEGDAAISSGSAIALEGGVEPSHVILNFVGEGSPVMIGGQSHISGTVLSLRRNVLSSGQLEIEGSLVVGRQLVTSGKSLTLQAHPFCLPSLPPYEEPTPEE